MRPKGGRKHCLSPAEASWNSCTAHLSSALEGEGNLVFVVGGPGRGKTALLNEFVSRASLDHPDLICLSGTCEAFFGIGDPYLPFREIMNTLAGDLEAALESGFYLEDPGAAHLEGPAGYPANTPGLWARPV